MRTDLLVQVLNAMPPEQLGQLIARIQQPQAYLGGGGYRGNLPVSMRAMQGNLGPTGLPAVRRY